MSNIYKAFENKKAFIPFVTGGDPDLETTKNLLIRPWEKAGADLIEIGIPFSDPIAEGPSSRKRAREHSLQDAPPINCLIW